MWYDWCLASPVDVELYLDNWYFCQPHVLYMHVSVSVLTLTLKHLQKFGIPKKMSNKVAFLSWKMCESCKIFDWNLFIMLLSMINQHWFKKWHGADLAPGHFLEQWWQKPMLTGGNFRCLWVNLISLLSSIFQYNQSGSLQNVCN